MTITANEMRERDYYGHLHYYYVFDMDLNANDMRLLMVIQQMQSNPDPKVKPFFSYAWIANLLGIKRRQAIYIAKKLKDKGYIIHKEMEDGKWLWKLPTKMVFGDDPNASEECSEETLVQSECTPPVQSHCTPLVHSECTHKYNNLKTNKTNTNTNTIDEVSDSPNIIEVVSSAFVISEEIDRDLLRFNQSHPLLAKDNREFLMWCKFTLETTIKADSPDGKVRVLKAWIKNGGLKKPSGYDLPKPEMVNGVVKPSNLGYGYTTQKPVEEVDKQIEEFAWQRVQKQKAPIEVLKAIAKDAANIAKSYLKPMEAQGGGPIAKDRREDVVALTVSLAALKNGQVKDLQHFKERMQDNPSFRSPLNSGIADLINKEVSKIEKAM